MIATAEGKVSSMRILLTGGAGFIGSHVSERLLRDGHTLTIVDDLNDFYSPAVKRANLEAVLRTGRAEKPDVIIHLAARAGVRPSLENPLLYQQVNVRGTMVLRW